MAEFTLLLVWQVDQRGILQVPGREWAVLRLGHPGTIRRVEIDTIHFKGLVPLWVRQTEKRSFPDQCRFPAGNFPDSCQVEVCSLSPDEEVQCIQNHWTSGKWRLLLPPQKVCHYDVCQINVSITRWSSSSLCHRAAPPSSHAPL